MKRITSLAGSAALVTLSCVFIAFFKIPGDCYGVNQSCYQKYFSVFFAFVYNFSFSLI